MALLSGMSIRRQIVTILVVTQLIAHIVPVALIDTVFARYGYGRVNLATESLGAFTSVLNLVDRLPEPQAMAAINAAMASDPRFSLGFGVSEQNKEHTSRFTHAYQDSLSRKIPAHWRTSLETYEIRQVGGWPPFMTRLGATVQLTNGQWLRFETAPNGMWQMAPTIVLSIFSVVLVLPLTFFSIWAGLVLVSPISRLAKGADRFSHDLDAPDIRAEGAREVRMAAVAINSMRHRIRSLVNDRSETLAAIGHDMRTPLTRLNLRAEAIAEADLREAVFEDLGHMNRMIDDALSFLRSQKYALVPMTFDLTKLSLNVIESLRAQGYDARFEGPDRLEVSLDQDLIRRVLENLTNNALEHAELVLVSIIEVTDNSLIIDISDNGPGMSEGDKKLMLEPFRRGDPSRGAKHSHQFVSAPSGFGLGLSITHNIITSHHGQLSLLDNVPTGLKVRLELPRSLISINDASQKSHLL
jgi:signal transduction histidine kinase